MARERWKDVVGFEGLYRVSDLGRVYSVRSEKILRPGKTSAVYPSVCLGRGNSRMVHRLVAEAFLGEIADDLEVCHKDGDRENPRLSNLRLGTRGSNVRDVVYHGRRKLSVAAIKKIRRTPKTLGSGARLAGKHNVSQSMISGIRNGVQYKGLK